MHRLLTMKASDLAELYCLLELYVRTYESPVVLPEPDLLNQIKALYEEQPARPPFSSAVCNPRGAGRKKGYPEEVREQILQLQREGLNFREIASRIPCSVGYIHKLIHERKDKRIKKEFDF